MTLSAGARLGHFEVLAPLGAGGMGEVYRAKDTRLDRTVAIKVLPGSVSAEPSARQRFEREARTISSLSHPHICGLFDVGRQDGVDFLVMEFVDGETLADRLRGGSLPLRQALRLGAEISDALDAAHRHGIVHRDLKPANVMLTKTGAKLLDFGLARLVEAEKAGGAQGLSSLQTPPRGHPLTEEGTIVGTVQYMAPEQLEGKPADARTDIFALGVLLHETVTGQRAFNGKSRASLIASILEHDPPPVSTLQPMAPTALDHVVRTCLAKDPEERWQTARDLAIELRWIADGTLSATNVAATAVRARRYERLAWSVVAVGLLVALGLSRSYRPPQEPRLLKLDVAFPAKFTPETYLALSRDGRRLAFGGFDPDGKTKIWVRALDADTAAPIPGTEGGSLPFFSPDGRELAFFAGNKLRRVNLSGGSPQTICDTAEGRGGTWSSNGLIVFAPDCCSGLSVVPASGGTPREATALESGHEGTHRWPSFLPDGQHFVFTVAGGVSGGSLYIGRLGSSEKVRLVSSESQATFEAPDHLFYVREGRLVTRRIDPQHPEVPSEEVPLADHVVLDQELSGLAAMTTSAAGVVAYRSGGQPLSRLTWYDRTGRNVGVVGEAERYLHFALSPDGQRVAAVTAESGRWRSSMSLVDTARGQSSRFTFENADPATPIWSLDGSRLLFTNYTSGHVASIYEKSTLGTGTEEPLYSSSDSVFADDWTDDGRYLVFERSSPKTHNDLWVLPLQGARTPQPFLVTPANEAHAKVSPDGKWIAYASDALGQPEVFVQPFPSGAGRWQVSTAGGDEPLWRRDGRELFYLSLDHRVMSIAVRSSPGHFEPAAAVPLFAAPMRPPFLTGNFGHYGVTPDGQRFLVLIPFEEAPLPMTVLLKWPLDGGW